MPFEFHEIVALAAPTPSFYNAQSDNIVPHWRTVGECVVDLRNLLQVPQGRGAFVSMIGAGGHDFPEPVRKMAYDFPRSVG